MRILRLAFALALAAAPTLLRAQQFPTVPTGTVIGRTQIGSGPAQAIPFSQLIALLLASSPDIPTINTNSIVFKGSTSGQATLQALGIAGTPTLSLPNTTGTLASNATTPIVLDPASGTISCPTCATSSGTANPVVASRATAETLNLTGLTALKTLGYATAGDGGGATFQNIGTASFADSYVASYTTTNGTAYANGTYYGVTMQTGTKPYVIGFVTYSGGVVTSTFFGYTPGAKCNVGDVYTPVSAFGGGTGFTLTVTSCTSPLGSFSDAVGNHFQIVTDEGAFPNALQFGCKGDWNNNDSTATDNFNCLQAGLWFAGLQGPYFPDAGGYWGGRFIVPQGSFMACGAGTQSLNVPMGVNLTGASPKGSVIRMCDAFNTSTHFIELCDPNWHFACFDSRLENITISARNTVTASGSTYMVHSNATQDLGGIVHVYIYSGGRGCYWYQRGYGGAGFTIIDTVSCSSASSLAQIKIGDTVASGLNVGSTIINMRNIGVGGGSSSPFQTGPGMVLLGGFANVEGFHFEFAPLGIDVAIPSGTGNGDIVRLHNINGNCFPTGGTSGIIQLDATNNAGNAVIGQVPVGSGCTNTVTDGQSGGTNRTTAIVADTVFNP
jgi:hypothetical protein